MNAEAQGLIKQILYKFCSGIELGEIEEILLFKNKYSLELIEYSKKKYFNPEKAKKEVQKSIKLYLDAVCYHAFEFDDPIQEIKNIISLNFYQKPYSEQIINFIKAKKDFKYISSEKKMKYILYPYIATVGTKLLNDFPNANDHFEQSQINLNWISNASFDIILNQILANKSIDAMKTIENIVYDVYCIFILRYYSKPNNSLKEKIFGEIKYKINIEYALLMKKLNRINLLDLQLLFNDSLLIFFNKIVEPSFVIKTSSKNYWKGIFENKIKENYSKQKINKELEQDSLFSNLRYPEATINKNDVLEFLNFGLEAIKDMNKGNAIGLLLRGKNSRIIKAIKDSLLFFKLKGIKPAAKYQIDSETTQRNKCKMALLTWMKAQVFDPKSDYYGQKGSLILEFICEKPFDKI